MLIAHSQDPLARLRGLVLDSVPSPHSRRAYARALDEFLSWYFDKPRGLLSKAVVQAYRAELDRLGLASSTINVRLAAIRKLASEAADNGLLDPVLAAGITRVKGAKQLGVRAGNWLTREEAHLLLRAPAAATLKGKRDRALLGVLIGCGLRRAELVALTVDHLQQREGRWVWIDLVGKGSRLRSVPVPAWVKSLLDDWIIASGIQDGKVFRAVDKVDRAWGSGITEKVVWWTVLEYAKPLGFAKLAPHDLRRTCAKLCRSSGGDLEQIQLLLGHMSIQTTERYLGTRQNLAKAVNDNLGIVL
ncbi:MAG: tyrosine-type recombinase/integrase [Bryobacteraceae bacterium]